MNNTGRVIFGKKTAQLESLVGETKLIFSFVQVLAFYQFIVLSFDVLKILQFIDFFFVDLYDTLSRN